MPSYSGRVALALLSSLFLSSFLFPIVPAQTSGYVVAWDRDVSWANLGDAVARNVTVTRDGAPVASAEVRVVGPDSDLRVTTNADGRAIASFYNGLSSGRFVANATLTRVPAEQGLVAASAPVATTAIVWTRIELSVQGPSSSTAAGTGARFEAKARWLHDQAVIPGLTVRFFGPTVQSAATNASGAASVTFTLGTTGRLFVNVSVDPDDRPNGIRVNSPPPASAAFIDPDTDGDGTTDSRDNCPSIANADQKDLDQDRQGDACDPDRDGDGTSNEGDKFPENKVESADADNDGVPDNRDRCPGHPDSVDADADKIPDACDSNPSDGGAGDDDKDGQPNHSDLCPTVAKASHADRDQDGLGDDCDPDRDGDGVPNDTDLNPDDPARSLDRDRDGIDDRVDVCPSVPDPAQADQDADGLGDACDFDEDGDGVPSGDDAFPLDADSSGDQDQDGVADGDDPCPLVAALPRADGTCPTAEDLNTTVPPSSSPGSPTPGLSTPALVVLVVGSLALVRRRLTRRAG